MQSRRIERRTMGVPEAYLANGLVGLRIGQIPLPHGAALVNGFVGLSPEKGSEEYAEAPFPVGADIEIDGVWLSERPDLAAFHEQEYDFARGELRSRFDFRVGDHAAHVDVLTFCSRTQPTLTLQQLTVTVDRPCRLTLQAHIDPRTLAGTLGYRCMPGRHQDAVLRWDARGGLSSVGAACASEFIGDDLECRRRNDYGHEEDLQLTHYSINARPGRHYALRQIGALVPGLMHGEPHWQAARMVGLGRWRGFDNLRADNRAAWAELWKSAPRLLGADPRWQRIADAAFFYLHSSVSPATPCSVAPFGLSRRKEYSGHVFWDYETFMLPPVLLSAPAAARATMEYRARLLDGARANAQLNGYRGVQFPWQSGNGGFEVSPFYSGAAGGAGEQHINLDVAFAMLQFVHASGDDLFARRQAWPVIQGVAEWIESRVTHTARGCEILHVTGIDEGRDNVDNDAMTNGLSAVILREADALARRLGMTPPNAWRRIADALFIPIDPASRRILQFEGFQYAEGRCSPPVMTLFFPFGYPVAPDVADATFEINLRNAHSYLGMPMNSCNFAVWAARRGERALALEFLEAGTASRVIDPYDQFVESSVLAHCAGKTVFVTACGALLTALLLGLTGLHLDGADPARWPRHPVVLPEGWDAIEIEQFWVRGRPVHLIARHGEPAARMSE